MKHKEGETEKGREGGREGEEDRLMLLNKWSRRACEIGRGG